MFDHPAITGDFHAEVAHAIALCKEVIALLPAYATFPAGLLATYRITAAHAEIIRQNFAEEWHSRLHRLEKRPTRTLAAQVRTDYTRAQTLRLILTAAQCG